MENFSSSNCSRKQRKTQTRANTEREQLFEETFSFQLFPLRRSLRKFLWQLFSFPLSLLLVISSNNCLVKFSEMDEQEDENYFNSEKLSFGVVRKLYTVT
jgi:hypothetical protein